MPSEWKSEQVFSKQHLIVVGIILLVIVGIFFMRPQRVSQDAALKAAQAEQAAQQATEAAKAANPFTATNPLQGVEANPFQKVKKVLNPFE